MNSDVFYFSIISSALVLSLMGLWFTAIMPGIDGWSKRFFKQYFIVFLLCCLSGAAEMLLWYYPAPGAVAYLILILECTILALPLPMVTAYLLHCCGEVIRASRLFRAALCLLAVYCVMLVSSPFIGGFTYLTPESVYERGPLYPLFLLPLVAMMLLTLVGAIRRRTRLSPVAFLSFLVAIVPMTAVLIVQVFVDIFAFLDIAYVLSALAMYGLVLSDQLEQNRRRQREITAQQLEIADQKVRIVNQQLEIANQRAGVMALQMRPHFICNTLMGIYSLCNQDPQKARQVTMDFTNYLRKNFNAVSIDHAIPFLTELEHTRAYLAVEQAQYEEMLVVDYDTPFTQFRLPALTLQPLVENAVKHGMDLDSEPLHISVRTRHADSAAEIVVADSGRGYAPAGVSDGHGALHIIRQRLEMMCGGRVTIAPGDGGGTVVTVTIPDDASQ